MHREYWRPGWLPFSEDGGGNAYAVGLAPAPGDTYEQVVVIGPDEEFSRRVLKAQYFDGVGNSPEEFTDLIERDRRGGEELVRLANVTGQP